MIFLSTPLNGLFVIESELRGDPRGYFTRIFCKNEFEKHGIRFDIVQASISFTAKKGTIRGMHFQRPPKEEDKIVQCVKGAIYDVALDLRDSSPTFGKWYAVELKGDEKKLFYIPRGFAHGFQTLTDDCEVQYLMSEFYVPECASGVRWNDPVFQITWPIEHPLASEKDGSWPLF